MGYLFFYFLHSWYLLLVHITTIINIVTYITINDIVPVCNSWWNTVLEVKCCSLPSMQWFAKKKLRSTGKLRIKEYLVLITVFVLIALINNNSLSVSNAPDSILYKNIAENFIHGHGLINTVRDENVIVPPFFPFLIALFLTIFGSISYFFVFQYFIFGLTAVLMFLIADRLFKNKYIGIFSVALYTIHPVWLNCGPQYLLTETVYTFIVTLIIYYIIELYNGMAYFDLSTHKLKTGKYLTILSILLSIGILTRPHISFLLPILLLISYYLFYRKLINIKNVIIVTLIPIILMGVAIINNYFLWHHFLIENYSGQNLYIANNPNTKVDFYSSTECKNFVEPYYFSINNLDLTVRNDILRKRAVRYILSHPWQTFYKTLFKTFKLLFGSINIVDGLTILFFVFGVINLLSKKDNRWLVFILFLIILSYTSLTSLGLLTSDQRYRAPIIPIFLIFSSYFICQNFINKKPNINN